MHALLDRDPRGVLLDLAGALGVTVGPSAAIWAFATSPCGAPIVAKRNVTDSAAAERMRTFTTTPS